MIGLHSYGYGERGASLRIEGRQCALVDNQLQAQLMDLTWQQFSPMFHSVIVEPTFVLPKERGKMATLLERDHCQGKALSTNDGNLGSCENVNYGLATIYIDRKKPGVCICKAQMMISQA